MVAAYKPLSRDLIDPHTFFGSPRDRREFKLKPWLMPFLVIVLLLSNIAILCTSHWTYPRRTLPAGLARTEDLNVVWKRFWWNTAYSSPNRTASDALWESILPSHGIVAVDREWAAEQQWPTSGYMIGDKSKGVYLLEAYHQLHCLRIIRKTFWEAVDHQPFTHPPGAHMDHCFDTLRQAVQCNADNTPLYTFGDFTAGDGQLHQCRDWGQLKDWATKNTACYRDSVEKIPYKDHFGHCDDGRDGVEAIDYGAIMD